MKGKAGDADRLSAVPPNDGDYLPVGEITELFKLAAKAKGPHGVGSWRILQIHIDGVALMDADTSVLKARLAAYTGLTATAITNAVPDRAKKTTEATKQLLARALQLCHAAFQSPGTPAFGVSWPGGATKGSEKQPATKTKTKEKKRKSAEKQPATKTKTKENKRKSAAKKRKTTSKEQNAAKKAKQPPTTLTDAEVEERDRLMARLQVLDEADDDMPTLVESEDEGSDSEDSDDEPEVISSSATSATAANSALLMLLTKVEEMQKQISSGNADKPAVAKTRKPTSVFQQRNIEILRKTGKESSKGFIAIESVAPLHQPLSQEYHEAVTADLKLGINFPRVLANLPVKKTVQLLDGEVSYQHKGGPSSCTMDQWYAVARQMLASIQIEFPGQGAAFEAYISKIMTYGRQYGAERAQTFDRMYRSRAEATARMTDRLPDWEPGVDFHLAAFSGCQTTLCWCGSHGHTPEMHDQAAHATGPGTRRPTTDATAAAPRVSAAVQDVCSFFNKDRGCKKTAAACTFKHVCNKCGGDHPRHQCPKATAGGRK